jgi:DNA-binding IclR family transcriptional regulator
LYRTPPRSVVARLTAILATFRTGSAHSVTELARLTGLPISTTHRMANDLASWNLLHRRPDATFEVGSALRGLGDGAWSFTVLQQHGPHLLTDLSDATSHRARLGVLVNGHIAYIEKPYGPNPVTTFSRGATLPAHATALGKALLAFTPPVSVAKIAGPLTIFTPRTLATPEGLHRELNGIRVRKLAVSQGEHFAEECTIAAPVFAPDGTVAAAVEIEVASSLRDLALCRAALAVGAGALSRELATMPAGDYRHLTIVPSPINSKSAVPESMRPAAGN